MAEKENLGNCLIQELTRTEQESSHSNEAFWDTCLDFDIPSPDGKDITTPCHPFWGKFRDDSPTLVLGRSPTFVQFDDERNEIDDYNLCLQHLSTRIPEDFLQNPISELSIVQDAGLYIQHLMAVLKTDVGLKDQTKYQCATFSDTSSTRSSDSPPGECRTSNTNTSAFTFLSGQDSSNWMSDVANLFRPSPEATNSVDSRSQQSILSHSSSQSMPHVGSETDDYFETPAQALNILNESETVSQSMFDAWTSMNLQKIDENSREFSSLYSHQQDDSNIHLEKNSNGYQEGFSFQVTDSKLLEDDGNSKESLFERFSREYPTLASVLLEQSKKGLVSDWSEADPGSGRAREIQTVESDSSIMGPEAGGGHNSDGLKISRPSHAVKVSKKSLKGPKRPKNGFIRFSVEQRRLMADEHPRLDNREVSRMLGAKWRKMSYEERKPYELEFKKDIEDLRIKNPQWRYAPMKRLSHDQIEPMPSRLRPRETLKRKPLKRGSGKKRTKRSSTSSSVQKFCFPIRLFQMNSETGYSYTSTCPSGDTNNQNQERHVPTPTPDKHTRMPAVNFTQEINTPTQYILYREPSWWVMLLLAALSLLRLK